MKTAEEIKARFNQLKDEQNNVWNQHDNGEISTEEWLNKTDAIDRKMAGWRRMALNFLANLAGVTYASLALANRMNDNIDLYAKYFKF